MKRAAIPIVVLLLAVVSVGGCAAQQAARWQGKQTVESKSFRIYDRNWNVQGYVRKGSFSDIHYLYDENWQLKGYIKLNSFSERYEIYDKQWKKKAYVEGIMD